MKVRVTTSLLLMTLCRPFRSIILPAGEYNCEKGNPPTGWNPDGEEWVYHKPEKGPVFGATMSSLNGAQIIE